MLELEGIEAKIERARTCLCDLDSEITNYCRDKVEQVRREARHLGAGAAFLLGEPANIPIDWPVSVGEIAYNLRSSLDHLVWQLVLHNGRTPTTANQFPIFQDEDKYKTAARRQLKGVSAPSRKVIEGLQPYQENDWIGAYLWILQCICNIDKHRHLNLVDHTSIVSAHLKEHVSPEFLPEGPLEGLVLFLYLEGSGQEHKIELDANLEVCFMDRDLHAPGEQYDSVFEDHPIPYPPVVSTLSKCVASVDAIVERFREGIRVTSPKAKWSAGS